MREKRNPSVTLPLILTVLFFGALIFLMVVMPRLATLLIDIPDDYGKRGLITDAGRLAGC